jgi:murein L,D-transpeptidase YafK
MMPATHLRVVGVCSVSVSALLTACGGSATRTASVEPRVIHMLPREASPVARDAMMLESSFAQSQLRYSRVREARAATQARIVQMFDEKNIRYPAAEMYLRVLKRPRLLELWVRPSGANQFKLLKTYPICAMAGAPGPKRRQGDQQVPEGFYFVDNFNPTSDYHLSLKIDYPNRQDRARNVGGLNLGGDIFIHGGCRSEGCLAVTNEGIQELYWIAVEARSLGQHRIPVHIFPARLDAAEMKRIDFNYYDRPDLIDFWKTLKPGYDYFERTHRVPEVGTDMRGKYRLLAS